MAWDDIPDWAGGAAGSILNAVKEKDPFTFEHCCRVGRLSRKLAKAIGLNEFEQAILEFSGLFHDVGKVGIPDSVLLKPARLTSEEIEVMKTHAERSVKIVEPLAHEALFRFSLPGIRYHHEKFDGSGYPFNLGGDDIPLAARIIAVVDTFDAMSHTRPYRKGLAREKILKELKNFSGTQFDGHIVQSFLEALPYWENEKQEQVDRRKEVVVAGLLEVA